MFSTDFSLFLKKQHFVIAIDGPGASGKTSLGKAIAQKYDINFLDSGLLYRLFIYFLSQEKISSLVNLNKQKFYKFFLAFEKKLQFLNNQFFFDDKTIDYLVLYGENIEKNLPLWVNKKWLRYHITSYCQKIICQKSCVLVGRDATTVIAPNALVKFYLDAKLTTRIARKSKFYKELQNSFQSSHKITPSSWTKFLHTRDSNDLKRKISPLKKAPDAVYVDNSTCSFDKTLNKMLDIIFNNLDFLPKIAIIGRTNVGKSSLFNLLSETKNALVSALPGTTRDPYYQLLKINNFFFKLIDTGGYSSVKNKFSQDIEIKTQTTIAKADLLLWVVDNTAPLLTNDLLINKLIIPKKAQTLLIINKTDLKSWPISPFKQLGIKNQINFSVKNRTNLSLLLAAIEKFLLKNQSSYYFSDYKKIKIAIIGQPNVGKSTLFNRIFEENIAITSAYPHTTTNFLTKSFFYKDFQLLFYDTAGVRRKKLKADVVEKKAKNQIINLLEEIDLVLLVVSLEGNSLTVQDRKMLALILEKEKPFLLIVNKKDLSDLNKLQIENLIKSSLPFFRKNKQKIFVVSTSEVFLPKEKILQHLISLFYKSKKTQKFIKRDKILLNKKEIIRKNSKIKLKK